ncbi:MAG: FAD-dependent oxidoreductase [Simkaniaceae bacterium]|nr:FAD-dependent oxidoreductase [Simkaniaceae bacterium]
MPEKTRIIILGGGFGGVYTAMYLESYLRRKRNHDLFEITLVNRENYFVFQPMLSEVVGGSLDILDTINSLRKLLPGTRLYVREIEAIDVENKSVTLSPKFSHRSLTLHYDHLVLALGNVTDFRDMSGLREHARPFKNLADAIDIRNQIIDAVEAASCEEDPRLRRQLLTFVVGGGGFSGTEVVAEVNDFVRKMAAQYDSVNQSDIRVVLIHSKNHLMEQELSSSLGEYAGRLLTRRGVEIRFDVHLISATPEEAVLDNGETILSKTIISTVPSSPNPLIDMLPLTKQHGKVITDATLQVEEHEGLWALGDCAAVPHVAGSGICPPTAQFAIRQAKVLAHNIHASLTRKEKKRFHFKALGMMGALGHHSAVAELFGIFKFSGLSAWLLWRAIYWTKLPGINRKIKVAISWILDTIIPSEAVQIRMTPNQGIAQLHFVEGEVIFHEGDVGDYLYIIVNGEVEVFRTEKSREQRIAKLGKGAYFGEMALLNRRSRLATVRCLSPVDVIALKKNDFGILISNFAELKHSFEQANATRGKRLSN